MRGFNFAGFKTQKTMNEDETKHSTFYCNSKAETIIHDLQLTTHINIWKYKPLSGSGYVKLSKESFKKRLD